MLPVLLRYKDINLDIHRGEIFSLLVPNGAGKITLISIVCGIVIPSGVQVIIDGYSIITDYCKAISSIGLVP